MAGRRFDEWARERFGPARVTAGAPLAPLTTLKVGGPAEWLVDVQSVEEMVDLAGAARAWGVPVTVIGGGSNLLIGDRGIRGVVARPRFRGISRPTPNRVRAEAGVTINGLVRWTVAQGLGGIEAWAGTPGTVGGAIYGNAHFAGRNISDIVADVMMLSPDGTPSVVPNEMMAFGYDASRVQRTRETVLWAEFVVEAAAPDALRAVARASLAHRKRTQPLDVPSAGCIFQNPDPARDRLPQDVPWSAGALVDRAGLKGHRIGGARISPVHANFFLNEAGATASDVRALIELARDTVRARFGVELRDEIVTLGEY